MGEYPSDLLQDYPFATVRLVCNRCEWQERYGKKQLIAVHGANATMLDLRSRIAKCDRLGKSGYSCEAYYPDLLRG
jgi:hypothetical protein